MHAERALPIADAERVTIFQPAFPLRWTGKECLFEFPHDERRSHWPLVSKRRTKMARACAVIVIS